MVIMNALPNSVFYVAADRKQEAQHAIRKLVASGVSRPADILERLGPQFGDFLVKEGVLRLLREGELALTSDRKLVLA